MSIFKKFKSIFLQKKALYILMIVCFQSLLFPIISYAQENNMTEVSVTAETGAASDASEAEEPEEAVSEEPADTSVVFKKSIFHQHTGNDGGGGCHTVERIEIETDEDPCTGTLYYNAATGKSGCSSCGAAYSGDKSGSKCTKKTYDEKKVTYYDIGCGKSESTQVGSLSVKQSTTEWVKSLTLTGSYEAGGMRVSSKPYIWNEKSATDNPVYEVTSCGNYSLRLNADENSNTAGAVIQVKVRNIDVTAPAIRAHTLTPDAEWTKEGVHFAVTEAVDLQPDGSDGCGLHEKPYSYDNGETWTEDATHLYTKNGTHSILVRDRLENVSSYEISFQNIDVTPPTLQTMEYDHTQNIRSAVLAITAADLQPDGSDGCGLHEKPYSYDGGKSWTAENTYSITKNGILTVAIRDKLGNVMSLEESITNIDCTGPTITYKLKPKNWTNQNVKLILSAKDINEDGSAGVGLADTWYSLDGGQSWSNQPELIYKKNTNLTVTARDQNDNRSTTDIRIKNIDKELPWVSLKMEVLSEGLAMKVKLQAYAGDDESGLHEEGYSWDKGASYSDRSYLMVEENGTYQVTVRDKAGNIRYEQIEVNVFPALFPILPIVPETEPEATATEPIEMEPATEEETQTEEWTTEVVTVTMGERIEQQQEIPVHVVQQDSIWDELLRFLLILAGILLLFLLLLLLWSRTIAVYVEKANGKLQYMGRLWISYKEDRYMVKIPVSIIEKAMTTHFSFKPSRLFTDSHEGEEMYFLFPEDVCITLTIERIMEME